MERQTEMFPHHAARNSDIGTSHESGAEITHSGKRRTDMMQVHSAVCKWPGRTARELAEVSGLPHTQCHKRLADLKNAGVVYQGEKTTCAISKRSAMRWYNLLGGAGVTDG